MLDSGPSCSSRLYVIVVASPAPKLHYTFPIPLSPGNLKITVCL